MPENLESLKNVDVLIAGDPREFRIVQGRKVNDWEEGEMWRILIKDLKSKVEFEVNAEILVKMPEKHDDDINPKYEILIIGEDENPIDNFTVWGTLEMVKKLAETICKKFEELEEKNIIQVMIYKTIKEVE